MAEYRTAEQYQDIVESMLNGNWTQAADMCIEYGFYSQDLLNALEADDTVEECSQYWCELMSDFVHLAELAAERRAK